MPKDTFYRLPEEKRQRLKRAIIGELARVPFAEVSINRIIQTAEIPRGSFYQYFSGKEDALFYVLQEYKNSMLMLAQENCSGEDIFGLCGILFSHTVKYALSEENFAVFRNVLPALRLSDLLTECYAQAPEECCYSGERDRLRTEIVLAVFKDSLGRIFANPSATEKTAEDFEKKLDLLRQIAEV